MNQSNMLNSPEQEAGKGTTLQNAAFRPLYKQIKDLLIQKLQAGEWKPGEPISSELDLVSLFGVSHGTIRKAIDELAAENVLIRRQGKGTFVATHEEASIRHRFLRFKKRGETAVLDDGDSSIKTNSSYLSLKIQPSADIGGAPAGIFAGDDVLQIHRIIEFDSVPAVVESIYLPGSIFGGLTLEALRANQGPLYGYFERLYGISMIRAEEELTAVAADKQASSALGVQAGHPLMQVHRVAFTYGDKPIEVRRGLYLTSDYYYHNSLN